MQARPTTSGTSTEQSQTKSQSTFSYLYSFMPRIPYFSSSPATNAQKDGLENFKIRLAAHTKVTQERLDKLKEIRADIIARSGIVEDKTETHDIEKPKSIKDEIKVIFNNIKETIESQFKIWSTHKELAKQIDEHVGPHLSGLFTEINKLSKKLTEVEGNDKFQIELDLCDNTIRCLLEFQQLEDFISTKIQENLKAERLDEKDIEAMANFGINLLTELTLKISEPLLIANEINGISFENRYRNYLDKTTQRDQERVIQMESDVDGIAERSEEIITAELQKDFSANTLSKRPPVALLFSHAPDIHGRRVRNEAEHKDTVSEHQIRRTQSLSSITPRMM